MTPSEGHCTEQIYFYIGRGASHMSASKSSSIIGWVATGTKNRINLGLSLTMSDTLAGAVTMACVDPRGL